MQRTRTTIINVLDRREQLRVAFRARSELLGSSLPIWLNPEFPLEGVHRDLQGNPYFEFDTDDPERVSSFFREQGYEGQTEVTPSSVRLGEGCANCGNVAGPKLPPVCPNCGFRDISPCPTCGGSFSRRDYRESPPAIVAPLFLCPNRDGEYGPHVVMLSYNEETLHNDGTLREPIVVVTPAVRP